jgi:hypothetical protein
MIEVDARTVKMCDAWDYAKGESDRAVFLTEPEIREIESTLTDAGKEWFWDWLPKMLERRDRERST